MCPTLNKETTTHTIHTKVLMSPQSLGVFAYKACMCVSGCAFGISTACSLIPPLLLLVYQTRIEILCVSHLCVRVCVLYQVMCRQNRIPGDFSPTKQRLLKITIAAPLFCVLPCSFLLSFVLLSILIFTLQCPICFLHLSFL